MADATANMVLRTVYLPRELDAKLKIIAFQEDRSKNDIVRELLQEGLDSRNAPRAIVSADRSAPRAVLDAAPAAQTTPSLSKSERSNLKQTPAVPIRSSVKHDYIVCLEDGKKLRMLKRYLHTNYGLTPEQYRQKWGLPADYPMVAPAYSEMRKGLAVAIGLGRKRVGPGATGPKPKPIRKFARKAGRKEQTVSA